MTKKILIVVVAVVIVAIAATVLLKGTAQKGGTGIEDLKKGVTKEAVEKRTKEIESSIMSSPGQKNRKIPPQLEQNIRQQAQDSLERERQMLLLADKQGVKVADNQLDQRLAQIKEMLNRNGRNGFKEVLKRENKTEDQFREMILKQMTFEELRKKLMKDVKVSDKEMKDYYEKNKQFFTDPKNKKKIRSFDEMKSMIKQMLISQKVTEKVRELTEGPVRTPVQAPPVRPPGMVSGTAAPR